MIFVRVKVVTIVSDFIKAWNSMPPYVDKIYLYFHGEENRLCFWRGFLYIQQSKNFIGPVITFSASNYVKVKDYVALFSCHGYVKDKPSVASAFYEKTKAPTIYACDGGVSYTRGKKIRARHSYLKSRGWFYSLSFNNYKYGTVNRVYGVLWL